MSSALTGRLFTIEPAGKLFYFNYFKNIICIFLYVRRVFSSALQLMTIHMSIVQEKKTPFLQERLKNNHRRGREKTVFELTRIIVCFQEIDFRKSISKTKSIFIKIVVLWFCRGMSFYWEMDSPIFLFLRCTCRSVAIGCTHSSHGLLYYLGSLDLGRDMEQLVNMGCLLQLFSNFFIGLKNFWIYACFRIIAVSTS